MEEIIYVMKASTRYHKPDENTSEIVDDDGLKHRYMKAAKKSKADKQPGSETCCQQKVEHITLDCTKLSIPFPYPSELSLFQVLSLNEFDRLHGQISRPWYFTSDYIHTFVKPDEAIWLCYFLQQKAIGAILVCRMGDEWSSIPRAPFGGFWFWDKDFRPSPQQLSKDLGQILKVLAIKQLWVRSSAAFYDLADPSVYLAEGWSNQTTSYTYALPLMQGIPQMGETASRKLRKMRREGFELRSWQPAANALHDFIADARRREGHQQLFSPSMAEEVVKRLGKPYEIEGVWKDGQLAAIGLALLATEGVMYHYQPADAADFRSWSPLVLCNWGLLQKAIDMKLLWLDLGTAAHDGKELLGLVHFKLSLGAKRIAQLSYVFKPA